MIISDILKQNLKNSIVLTDEPMANHTSFRIGGKADCYVDPSFEDLKILLQICDEQKVPVTVIGNGTNLLVGDGGIRGVCVAIAGQMSGITVLGDVIKAAAGELLSTVSKTAMKHSLSGLEYAFGIPGSIGGAVVMNAGAYGGEIKDSLISVDCVDRFGKCISLSPDDCKLSYRSSVFMENDYIIISAKLALKKGDSREIQDKITTLTEERRSKQPLEYPSAGSTFKRPIDNFAGKLIMDAGLKGYTVGGARVSEKHAGFVINTGNATAKDVRNLMEDVTVKVYDMSGIKLEPEVKFVGEF